MTRAPRCIPLADAIEYLGGRHPSLLGITPVMHGVYDVKALDAALDEKSGLTLKIGPSAALGAANDISGDEIGDLADRIRNAADASRRS
jgi:hypothetical protein